MEDTCKILEFLDDDSDDEKIVSFINSLTEEEVDGEASSSKFLRSRVYIAMDCEDAAIRLYNDYFSETSMYPENKLKRRYRMSSQLFLRIVEGRSNFNSTNIPKYFLFFRERPDATGRQSLTILQKCTAAIRQMAYGTTPDLFDEYIKIGEKTAALCLDYFCKCVFHLFAREYLRKPTAQDIARLYNFHEQKHSLPGMLGSIDCMHWEWKNCHVGWQGQYTRGANNDINVLNASPIFNTIKNGTAPPSPFDVNGHHYERGYYLGDENNGYAIERREERMIERNPPRRLQRDLRDRDARVKEIRDKQVHQQLEADLTEHVWNLSPYFRSANNNE
ncbi:uncharacterized protein [Rutidosis leptorrhynchoides]|uniref:uncharacterized protein n=1 Tax=Rutidosis leptorrhynchoides TaxID=125765 RepID=UPI003A9A1913